MHGWSLKELLAGLRRATLEVLPWPAPFGTPDPAPPDHAPPDHPPLGHAPPDHPPPDNPPSDPRGMGFAVHARPGLAPGAALVVLLHGCAQDAQAFAAATGWISQALALGFVLLVPSQSAQRNPQRCFSWFDPAQRAGPDSEVTALMAMIDDTAARWRCDPRRLHVVGFSAGGGMAAVLMAAWPGRFAAGAVIAGLPAGAASGLMGAQTRMSGRGEVLSAAAWAARARGMAQDGKDGSWPRLLVWHGRRDPVVDPANGRALAAQWSALHGLGDATAITKPRSGVELLQWRRNNENVIVALFLIENLGHAYPAHGNEAICAFVEASDTSATDAVLTFWNMTLA